MALRENFDILLISERCFNFQITNARVEIEGCRVYRIDRIGKAGAGVWAYVHQDRHQGLSAE